MVRREAQRTTVLPEQLSIAHTDSTVSIPFEIDGKCGTPTLDKREEGLRQEMSYV